MGYQKRIEKEESPDKTSFPAREYSGRWVGQKDFYRVGGVSLVFVIALVVRLIYLWQIKSIPLFDAPIVDAVMYDQSAMEIVRSTPVTKAFYQAPLYSYFLALIYKIFGHDYLVPRLVQSIIGAVNCVMVMLIGERLFGWRAGLLAGCIALSISMARFFGRCLSHFSDYC